MLGEIRGHLQGIAARDRIMGIRFGLLFVFICLFMLSCPKNEVESPRDATPTGSVFKIRGIIAKDAPGLLFRYVDLKSGDFQSAESPDKVPQESRRQVLLFVTSKENFPPPGKVALIDLTQNYADGYHYTIVDRIKTENALLKLTKIPLAPVETKSKIAEVVLYTIEGCAYCNRARAYLQAKKIPFRELDLEKDVGARADLMSRAKEVGFQGDMGGVPILYANGKMIQGYDPQAYLEVLGK